MLLLKKLSNFINQCCNFNNNSSEIIAVLEKNSAFFLSKTIKKLVQQIKKRFNNERITFKLIKRL